MRRLLRRGCHVSYTRPQQLSLLLSESNRRACSSSSSQVMKQQKEDDTAPTPSLLLLRPTFVAGSPYELSEVPRARDDVNFAAGHRRPDMPKERVGKKKELLRQGTGRRPAFVSAGCTHPYFESPSGWRSDVAAALGDELQRIKTRTDEENHWLRHQTVPNEYVAAPFVRMVEQNGKPTVGEEEEENEFEPNSTTQADPTSPVPPPWPRDLWPEPRSYLFWSDKALSRVPSNVLQKETGWNTELKWVDENDHCHLCNLLAKKGKAEHIMHFGYWEHATGSRFWHATQHYPRRWDPMRVLTSSFAQELSGVSELPKSLRRLMRRERTGKPRDPSSLDARAYVASHLQNMPYCYTYRCTTPYEVRRHAKMSAVICALSGLETCTPERSYIFGVETQQMQQTSSPSTTKRFLTSTNEQSSTTSPHQTLSKYFQRMASRSFEAKRAKQVSSTLTEEEDGDLDDFESVVAARSQLDEMDKTLLLGDVNLKRVLHRALSGKWAHAAETLAERCERSEFSKRALLQLPAADAMFQTRFNQKCWGRKNLSLLYDLLHLGDIQRQLGREPHVAKHEKAMVVRCLILELQMAPVLLHLELTEKEVNVASSQDSAETLRSCGGGTAPAITAVNRGLFGRSVGPEMAMAVQAWDDEAIRSRSREATEAEYQLELLLCDWLLDALVSEAIYQVQLSFMTRVSRVYIERGCPLPSNDAFERVLKVKERDPKVTPTPT